MISLIVVVEVLCAGTNLFSDTLVPNVWSYITPLSILQRYRELTACVGLVEGPENGRPQGKVGFLEIKTERQSRI